MKSEEIGKKIKKAIKENWDDHTTKEFLEERDPYEVKEIKKIIKKGYDNYEKDIVDQLVEVANDSDTFWDYLDW